MRPTAKWLFPAIFCAFIFLSTSLFSATSNGNIFAQRNCTTCHSVNGETTPGKGPSVASMHTYNSILDFGARMWNHGPAYIKEMERLKAPIPKLEAKDIGSLISYLTAFKFYTGEKNAAGDASRGELAWKGLKCSACHSLEGDKTKLGSDLRAYKALTPVKMAQAMWDHGPKMTEAMRSHGINPPRLTGSDMLNLLAYIRSKTGAQDHPVVAEIGDPTLGGEVFAKKQCTTCHPVSESATQFGPKMERKYEFNEGTAGVAALMWNHSVGMRDEMKKAGLTVPAFTGNEMQDLLAYLYVSAYSEAPGDPIVGKQLFELKKCTSCHADTRAASGATTSRSSLSVVASMWNHLPAMAQGSAAFPMIRPGEMKSLVAYLEKANLTAR